MDYGNICMRHYAQVCTISSDEHWRAWKRCKSRVSASSWLPWSFDPAHMSMMLVNNPTNHGWKEEDGKLLPIWTTLSLATPLCEVHLVNYLLSVQMHENKVEVYTSVQVHTRGVAGLKQFPILTVYRGLGYFLIECIVQGVFSSNCASIYEEVQGGL